MAKLCPLLKKDCIEHGCKFYVHLLGKDPQTSKEIDKWDCSFAWLPILLIENAQQSRQTGAAVESFRNEMVQANAQAVAQQFMLGVINDAPKLENGLRR